MSRALPKVAWQELPEHYREILRELGHTKQTYEKVQTAEQLLAEVNRSMRRRKTSIKYGVGFTSGPSSYLWKRH